MNRQICVKTKGTGRGAGYTRLFYGILVMIMLLLLAGTPIAGAEGLLCDICGKPITTGHYVQLPDGKTYHKYCFDHCTRCALCSRPVKSHEKVVSLSGGRVCHPSCFKKADICGICGEPICQGDAYRRSEASGAHYHDACFDRVPRCGLTGRPIVPGTAYVRIGDETFIQAEYDQCRKCLVSGLPVANHGTCIVNPRSETYVLRAYAEETRQCYSCGDHRMKGIRLDGDLFLCSYCYENGIKDQGAARPHIKAVRDFFQNQGVTVPANVAIRILPPGQLIDDRQPELKGCCRTHCAGENGKAAGLSFTVELLWGLNPEVFARVAAHELSHAIIGEAMISRTTCRMPAFPYEEGRCEFAAYTFARTKPLPDYIIDGFSENELENYRSEFLHVQAHPPASIQSLLTETNF
ncbi:MAG: hypothetical protein SWH68_10620 [Thermodesulfobacteriota bacterium]|nr:hypothetical protein [Thermodesulfobacteriota bacterium]